MRITAREMATILAALDAWNDELSEGMKWIAECHSFGVHSPLTREEVRELRQRLRQQRVVVTHDHMSESWSVSVPTFVGHQTRAAQGAVVQSDFSDPYLPIIAYEEGGLRIILGAADIDDDSKPDLKIERRPHGWAFFLHPNAGDPIAMIYLLDDGRSYLMPESFSNPRIEIVDDIPTDLDGP